MISYAQNFEDVVLNRVFHSVNSGQYVDIGAYHPVIHSVTKHFYDRGWSGINVEPVQRFWKAFQKMRPRDKNLNIVVGSHEGYINFHELGDSGLSTYKNIPDSKILSALELEKATQALPMTTLAQITEELALSEVEFLKIDVEGAERDVLLGADFEVFRPMIIVIEAIEPKLTGSNPYNITPTWPHFEKILFDNNYKFGLFDGLNRFYYRSENPELREPLSYPANVTDGFNLHRDHFLMPSTNQKPQPKGWRYILSKFTKKCKYMISNYIGVRK